MYQALPLLLLSLLLLVGQLSTLTHASALKITHSSSVEHCQSGTVSDCHTAMAEECCTDTLNDCVIKCAQGSAWAGTLPIQLSLALVRAMPPPAEQRLTDQPPEPPYQPPRLLPAA
ncbi:hypothetical protein GCM10009109_22220 [Marinobacterium sediminicola]